MRMFNCSHVLTRVRKIPVFDKNSPEHLPIRMDNVHWETESKLAFRLGDLEAEIERTKDAELKLLREIWLDKLQRATWQKPDYILWLRVECRD
jgi:hypothetical protein